MKKRSNYLHTIYACYIGFITQAIVNNLAPLLFLTFMQSFSLTLEQITIITTLNFSVQLLTDLVAVKLVDKIGYRASAVTASLLSGLGLICMALLPDFIGYGGLLTAVILYAIGGGLLEVIISPIVEACPTEHKESAMSLLHSFYCWGHVAVVLLSTLFFTFIGIDHWRILVCIWAIIPLANLFNFLRVPIYEIVPDDEKISLKSLAKSKVFWVFLLLMVCAGAAEQAMSQWSSAFAESALHVSKSVGDLAGPCAFALLMGTARALYGKFSKKIPLKLAMAGSAALCILCYIVTALSGNAVLALIGCAVTGFSVGIFWPGTFSLAAQKLRGGGTALFAIMALAGDLGCTSGPTLVGFIAGGNGGDFAKGILIAIAFPIIIFVTMLLFRKTKKNTDK